MAMTTTVELPKGSSGTKFSASAEWRDERSHFAVVRFYTGKVEAFALRLDLDKRVFLDLAPDAETDERVQARVLTIWSEIVSAKRAALTA